MYRGVTRSSLHFNWSSLTIKGFRYYCIQVLMDSFFFEIWLAFWGSRRKDGKWQARIGRVGSRDAKDIYLGTFGELSVMMKLKFYHLIRLNELKRTFIR